MSTTIAVFTGKNLPIIEKEGGAGYWIVQSKRVLEAKYALLIRNHRESWSVKNDGLDHGQAFLIGKISGCVDADYKQNRKVIQFSEYALLPNQDNFKSAWKHLTDGQRYPIAYLNTDEILETLDLDLDQLEWMDFNDLSSPIPIEAKDEDSDEKLELPDAMLKAKRIVADAANVDTDQVTIQINF